MEKNLEDYLRHSKIELMTKSVFLSTICLSLKHVFTDQIPTAGTNGITIMYNPEFFERLSPAERTGLLAHEVWHVAFNHLSRVGSRDFKIWNMAGDYVINYMLVDNGYTLPADGLLDNRFSDMSTEQVYDIIKEENPEGDVPGGDFIIDLLDAPEGATDKEINDLVSDIIIKAQLQSRISEKDHGEIPQEISRAIDDLINPKLPWDALLQRFLSDTIKDDYTWTRPNKRFFPAHYLPSQHSPTLGNIVFAIDTSGSVSQEELTEMLSEIESIRETFKPESIKIIDCDSRIHNVHIIEKYDNILDIEFVGNGGTDFKPVFNYCEEHEPDLLVYFTDLYADDITEQPNYPVMWICNSEHSPASIGETVYIG
jgi:predicted metal-dependent peptidase